MPSQTPPSATMSTFRMVPYPSADIDSHYSRRQNIDDIVYRYSAEKDRGTPKIGIYSHDGLWDEEETSFSDAATTIRPESGSTFGASKSKPDRNSVKSRSRSGTMSSAAKTESGMWGSWGKKNPVATPLAEKMPNTTSEAVMHGPAVPPKGLEKKKSKSMLRGKGRRGELSVNISHSTTEEEAVSCQSCDSADCSSRLPLLSLPRPRAL